MLRVIIWGSVAILIFLAATLVSFVDDIPTTPVGDSVTTDAIVVLTGGSLRLSYGFELLAKGKADKLFISGVHDEADLNMLMSEHHAPVSLQKRENIEKSITLDYVADNTRKNAIETAKWAKKEGVRSIRLVTANYHLPRSMIEFERAMPDVVIIPDPVFPEKFTLNSWWRDKVSRPLVLSEFFKYIAVWNRWDILAGIQSEAP